MASLTHIWHVLLQLTLFRNSYIAIIDYGHQLRNLITPYLLPFIILLTLFMVGYIAIKIWLLYRQVNRTYTLLEVIPPHHTEQNSYSTDQLFTLIHRLAHHRSKLYRWFHINKFVSFEIVASKTEGIRYVIRIESTEVNLIHKTLESYLPGITIKEINEYLPEKPTAQWFLSSYSQAHHFAYPLKPQRLLEKYDPMATITGSMTKLNTNELAVYQLVVSPINKSQIPDLNKIAQLIRHHQDLRYGIGQLSGSFKLLGIISVLLKLILQILFLPLGLLIFLVTEGREGPLLRMPTSTMTSRTDPYQNELEEMVKAKIDQELFKVSMRYFVALNNKESVGSRVKGFGSALSIFTNPAYQSLKPIFNWLNHYFFLYHRTLNLFQNSILSITEVADLYHFPYTKTNQTENMVKQYWKALPAPLSLKQTNSDRLHFAFNKYGDTTTSIGLTSDERRRHIYVLGATGTGKSTLLLSMIKQDIEHGKGIGVIDPHGELIDWILPMIPQHRIKDVVYFNPEDISFPVGLNILEVDELLTGDALLQEQEFVAESIISLFHKLFGDNHSGPRMEYILRNAIYTAFTTKDPTLFTINKLLTNTDYRKKIVKDLDDESLRDFWKYEFGKAGDYQKVSMILPITNKIGRFQYSPSAKRILEQSKSTIDFNKIMDEGKILLCNLPKGKLGEDTTAMFGVLVLTKIQLAALRRARINQADRKDFYLYVDEFQNFATPSFAQILSEARKYRLNAILAHQTMSQLEDASLTQVMLANVGTVVCFRTANPEDEKVILPQFQPYVAKGEIANLPSYHFYIKISALSPEEPFSGETIPVTITRDSHKVTTIIDASRSNYAHRYEMQPVIKTETVTPSKPKSTIKPKIAAPSMTEPLP